MKKLLLPIFLSFYLNVNSQNYFAGTQLDVYFDIDPDTLLNYTLVPFTDEKFRLNLFDDLTDDIEFTARGAGSSGGSDAYISATSLNPNVFILFGRLDSVWVIGDSKWNVTQIAKPLNLGDTINAANAIWEDSTLYITDHSGHSGGIKNVNDWLGEDKYLGIKYQNGSNIIYGWMRLQCPSEDSCYGKDFSYSLSSVAIHETDESKVGIYPNPTYDVFYLSGMDEAIFDPSKFQLVNIYGQCVKFKAEAEGSDLRIVPDSNLPPGNYLIQYSSNDLAFTKKLVVINERD